MKFLLSKVYELLIRLRGFLYRRGFLNSRQLNNPVVSVGNLTVGGTGKTPLVCFLAQILKDAGYQPIILSRGYQRKNKSPVLVVTDGQKIFCNPEVCGDEPHLLARKLDGVPVVVGKDRYRAARFVEDRYQNVIHLLDDGYQHFQLKRNLNILILDATDPFGGHQLLPAGRLREPVSALQRADSIIITRSHIASDPEELETQIRKWNKLVPIHHFYHDVTSLYDLKSGVPFATRDFFGKHVIALAAIGNPQVFLHDLEHYQMKVVEWFVFRDHYRYTQVELDGILKCLQEIQADAIVTTEKDAVRLENLFFKEGQIFVAQIEMKPEDPLEHKREFLNEVEFPRHPL